MDEKIVLAIALKKARQASSVTQEKVTEAVSDYITDNPNILNQAAVEAIVDDRIDDIVLVQDEQPTEEDNKIWIPNENIGEVQVPTYEEFSGLKNEVDAMGSATSEDEGKALIAKTVSNGKVTEWEFGDAGGVQDVQVNGTSILDAQGVANVPLAETNSKVGVVRPHSDYGTRMIGSNNDLLSISAAGESQIKAGTHQYKPITPNTQHIAAFYGLAKAAGANEKDSTLPAGQYTEPAKSAIRSMLGVQNFDPQSIAIVANGDTHAAIASGQYVYVQNHSSLTEGLYKARETIQVDGELSLSKLTAVSNGGLNALNSMIPEQLIHMGTETDYPLSAAHTEYPMGITLIYTLVSTSYPYSMGTVVTIRAANARCVQFSFGNTSESYSMRVADLNGWSVWKTYTGS